MSREQEKGFFGRLTDGAVWAILIALVLDFVTTNIFGLFLFLWVLASLTTALVLAGVVNSISWNVFESSFTLSDQWWFWVPSILVGALISMAVSVDAYAKAHSKK
jgi:hypothetical protein